MRVIAGEYRSRILETLPGDNTRPTSDKVKGAIFSALGGSFYDGVMLDLFAGSGSMGIEALSRGCGRVVFCDQSKQAIAVIEKNIKNLKIEKALVLHASYEHALRQLEQNKEKFDLVFLDPPYALQVHEQIIATLLDHDVLQPGGKIVVETSADQVLFEGYKEIYKIKEKVYGKTRITYFQRRGSYE